MTPDLTRTDTRAYYEAEAVLRRRGELRGLRVEIREAFIAQLTAEARSSVIDFGAGPGRDCKGFADAGFATVGVDLAIGNGRLAAEQRLHVVAGDVTAPPIRPGAFDAGWSMSTLMHLPADEMSGAVAAMSATLVPGAPMCVALWGWHETRLRIDSAIEGQQRPFHGRTAEHNGELFEMATTVESIAIHDIHNQVGSGQYQVFHLRTSVN